MRHIPKLVIFLLFFVLLPFLLVQTSRQVFTDNEAGVKAYNYTYDELYDFVYNSMSELVFSEDEVKQIFAKDFAETYQGKDISFKDLFRVYIDGRFFLMPAHDLIFKLGLVDDYYSDPYLTLLFKDPEGFAEWVNNNAVEYKDFFALYANELRFSNLESKQSQREILVSRIMSSDLSADKMVELAPLLERFEDFSRYSRIMHKISKLKDEDFSNAGFVNDSWNALASYYHAKGDKESSFAYSERLLDVFSGNEFYYPFTRHIDAYSDVMVFMDEINDDEGLFFKIINRVFANESIKEIKDQRLLSQIYLNLSTNSVMHLNPDYAYDLALELNELVDGNVDLANNYFLQMNKFNIFNILTTQADFYNLALFVDEFEFLPILNNKHSNYGQLFLYKLIAAANSEDVSYDQNLVDGLKEYVDSSYEFGSAQYVQAKQFLIQYLLKSSHLDDAIVEWNELSQIISNGNESVRTKLVFLLSSYQYFSDSESQQAEIKGRIMDFSKHHYIKDKDFKVYIRYLLSQESQA